MREDICPVCRKFFYGDNCEHGWGDVDPAFIQFIYSKQDYDHQKNEQFYIVPEDGVK
jgi:hypothetical protein